MCHLELNCRAAWRPSSTGNCILLDDNGEPTIGLTGDLVTSLVRSPNVAFQIQGLQEVRALACVKHHPSQCRQCLSFSRRESQPITLSPLNEVIRGLSDCVEAPDPRIVQLWKTLSTEQIDVEQVQDISVSRASLARIAAPIRSRAQEYLDGMLKKHPEQRGPSYHAIFLKFLYLLAVANADFQFSLEYTTSDGFPGCLDALEGE